MYIHLYFNAQPVNCRQIYNSHKNKDNNNKKRKFSPKTKPRLTLCRNKTRKKQKIKGNNFCLIIIFLTHFFFTTSKSCSVNGHVFLPGTLKCLFCCL